MKSFHKRTIVLIAVLAVLTLLLFINIRWISMIVRSAMIPSVLLEETESWENGISYEYLPYSDVSATDYLHLYVPHSTEPMPLVIMVHGGGFILGDCETRQAQYVYRYFRDHGYASATINYRLAEEAPYPAAIEDVKAAVRFLRAHAAEYGYDPERFVILGESAGGYLATMAAVTSDEEFCDLPFIGQDELSEAVSAKVSALVDFYGIMDFYMEDADWKQDGVPGFVVSLANSWMWGNTGEYDSWMDYWLRTPVIQASSPEAVDVTMEFYSPAFYLRKNFTPDSDFHVMIFHGDADITVSQQNSNRLYDVCVDTLGSEKVTYTLYPSYGHAADMFFSPENMDHIKENLDSWLLN